MMEIRAVRTEGLGDSTYVLTHQGVAVVVDPQRDIDRFEKILDEAGAELRFVLETHLHNDYVSGGKDLAKATGGELVFPAGAAPVFRHSPAFHQEDIEGGPLTIRPLHTPGHTPEHMSYLVLIDDRPMAVFSGGSLLVGSAGRSDLLGDDRAESLARLQYISVNRLAKLDDEVGLYPTHGAGSFCTATVAGAHTSTIGEEKRANPVLAYPDVDSFVEGQLSGLVPYPSYYRYMGPANVAGVDPLESYEVAGITEENHSRLGPGVTMIDGRPKAAFARGHLPGSIAVELRDDFGVWVGWVVPYNAPLVLVMNSDQDTAEAVRQLARIGFDDVLGAINDLDDWTTGLDSYRLVGVDDFAEAVVAGAQILDVRAPDEWESGAVRHSVMAYAPDVVDKTPDGLDPSRPVWIYCSTGYRANIAASALEARGYEPIVLADAGVTELLRALSNKE
jgi:glyoxylase-like metal-dependent hydrolase (beta-lactamase superfamily II)